jgi:hypothetical protein
VEDDANSGVLLQPPLPLLVQAALLGLAGSYSAFFLTGRLPLLCTSTWPRCLRVILVSWPRLLLSQEPVILDSRLLVLVLVVDRGMWGWSRGLAFPLLVLRRETSTTGG